MHRRRPTLFVARLGSLEWRITAQDVDDDELMMVMMMMTMTTMMMMTMTTMMIMMMLMLSKIPPSGQRMSNCQYCSSPLQGKKGVFLGAHLLTVADNHIKAVMAVAEGRAEGY